MFIPSTIQKTYLRNMMPFVVWYIGTKALTFKYFLSKRVNRLEK